MLKKILYRYVPRPLVDRPKQGFAIPLEQWLRKDLEQLTQDSLHADRIRRAGMFDSSVVQRVLDGFYQGDGRLAEQLWFLLAFELWRDKWGGDVLE